MRWTSVVVPRVRSRPWVTGRRRRAGPATRWLTGGWSRGCCPSCTGGARPRGLGNFFHSILGSLQAVAPTGAEDPRIVVLSPGTHSETAFDQAFLASMLGLPLVESADLTVRGGRLWMRALGRYEPVDVVLRRVDANWSDPLDLRPDSQLGVVGLTEVCRRGTVTVVNSLGSGVLENPGLLPYLPALSRELLGEELKMQSVPTFWCGDRSPGSPTCWPTSTTWCSGRPAPVSSVVPSLLSTPATRTPGERGSPPSRPDGWGSSARRSPRPRPSGWTAWPRSGSACACSRWPRSPVTWPCRADSAG